MKLFNKKKDEIIIYHKITITVPCAALRAEPSFGGESRGSVERGAVLEYVSHKNGWYKLKNGLYISDTVVEERE